MGTLLPVAFDERQAMIDEHDRNQNPEYHTIACARWGCTRQIAYTGPEAKIRNHSVLRGWLMWHREDDTWMYICPDHIKNVVGGLRP